MLHLLVEHRNVYMKPHWALLTKSYPLHHVNFALTNY
jgi:hypothetical protein